MYQNWRFYIGEFLALDEQTHPAGISNDDAEDFLAEQIPILDCPDKELERIYYFRWWTFRKHLRETPYGHVVTEFAPKVPWSGPFNSIICAAGFHVREGRWLKDGDGWIKECIRFWFHGHGQIHDYSCWLPHAVWEYCNWKQDWDFAVEMLPYMVKFFLEREADHLRGCGLYWSDDNLDGMEFSISGPGLRPTLNSYACADAFAISAIAKLAGDEQLSAQFAEKAASLWEAMERLLWDGDFYKTIPLEKNADPALFQRPPVDADHDVRELVGFIPWYFNLPPQGKEAGFAQLMDERFFRAPYGLTSAEQGHHRFMQWYRHECLWNGPVWPFATTQVIVAASNVLRSGQGPLSAQDIYSILRTYAINHKMHREDGSVVPWIDENMHPYTGRWLTRDLLISWDWKDDMSNWERGKDYNHSMFCDLVLSSLLGIGADEHGITVSPLIPEDWRYFRVENLWHKGKPCCVTYDADGSHYGQGAGLRVHPMES